RDAPGQSGGPPRTDRIAHGSGHQGGVLCPGDGCGQEYCVTTQLHGQCCVTGGTDPRIDDDGDLRLLDDQLQVVGIADAKSRTDRCGQGHHRGTADLLQTTCQHRVVVGVRQYGEPLVDEEFGRVQKFHGVGQQCVLVGDHLQLDPGRLQRLPSQTCGAYGVGGGEAARGVGQCPDLVALQNLPHRAFLGGGDVPHRDGGQFRLGSGESLLEHVEGGGSPGTGDEPRGEGRVGDDERVVVEHAHPPCTAVRTSTRSPGRRRVVAQAVRRTTSSLTATAIPPGASPPSGAVSSRTIVPTVTSG